MVRHLGKASEPGPSPSPVSSVLTLGFESRVPVYIAQGAGGKTIA